MIRNIIYNLSTDIEKFVYNLPEQIDNLLKLIHDYKLLIIENDKLKNENKILKEQIIKYENIPTIFCEIL